MIGGTRSVIGKHAETSIIGSAQGGAENLNFELNAHGLHFVYKLPLGARCVVTTERHSSEFRYHAVSCSMKATSLVLALLALVEGLSSKAANAEKMQAQFNEQLLGGTLTVCGGINDYIARTNHQFYNIVPNMNCATNEDIIAYVRLATNSADALAISMVISGACNVDTHKVKKLLGNYQAVTKVGNWHGYDVYPLRQSMRKIVKFVNKEGCLRDCTLSNCGLASQISNIAETMKQERYELKRCASCCEIKEFIMSTDKNIDRATALVTRNLEDYQQRYTGKVGDIILRELTETVVDNAGVVVDLVDDYGTDIISDGSARRFSYNLGRLHAFLATHHVNNADLQALSNVRREVDLLDPCCECGHLPYVSNSKCQYELCDYDCDCGYNCGYCYNDEYDSDTE